MRATCFVSLAPLLAAGIATAAPTKVPPAIAKQLDAITEVMLHADPIDKLLAPDALTDIQRDLTWPGSIDLGTPAFGWTGKCGWVSVEAAIRSVTHPELQVGGAPPLQPSRPWHWLELVVADGTGYATKAMGFYATMPDSSLKNSLSSETKELPVAQAPSQLVGWLAHPTEIAKHLSTDPAVTVYGTSAADHAVGPAAAAKLLASWNKLALDVVTPKIDSDDANHELVVGDCAAVTARLRMKYKDGAVMLHAFAIAHKVATGWEIVALQYATDSTFD